MVCNTVRGKIRKMINGDGRTASILKAADQQEEKRKKNNGKNF